MSSHADLVLTGGRIFTADAAKTWAQALAVRDGRIVVVGADRDVRPLVGPSTRVIELRGQTVTPGFGDSHVHPISSGVERLQCELTELRGLDAYLEAIAAYAAAHPEAEWIEGGGWSLADFPGGVPRREDLDRVVPGRPVFLPNRDGHDAWVNTEALVRAGIWKGTADPPAGRIARDDDGNPVGTLHENAMALVGDLIPPPSPELMRRGLLESQQYLHSLGITNWQDAIVDPDNELVYRQLGESGELTARVVGSMPWGSSRTSTPSAIARCARRSMRSRPRARRTAGPTRGRTSPTSKSSTLTTCHGSAASARLPTPKPCGP
jgi:predicted amidohydrolase YtcJ